MRSKAWPESHVDTVAARLAVMLVRHGRYVAFTEAEEA